MYAARACHIFARFISMSFVVLYVLLIIKNIKYSHANEIKAFTDFMDYAYLKHGIIVQNEHLCLNKIEKNAFSDKYFFQFLKIRQNLSMSDFNQLFDGRFSRTGIFVPIFGSRTLQQQILNMASTSGLFNNSYSWFILSDDRSSNTDFIRNELKNLQIEVNADITIAVKKKNSSLLFFDVYKICAPEKALLNVEYKGNWSLDTGLSIQLKYQEGFVRRRRNFCNSSVKAGTALLENPGNITNLEHLQNTKDNRHFDMMQRKTFNLMKMMEPLFNMSLNVVFTDSWGIRLPNGTWTGVIGDIAAQNVEFSICPLRYYLARAEVLRFTTALHTEHIRFVLRHPRRATIRNIFFEPLSPTVWWCILAVTVYLVLQLSIHVRLEYRTRSAQRQDRPMQIEPRVDFVVLQILEAIFMQGPAPDLYTFLSTRTLILATCIFSVMLLQFYSAFIVGSLLAAPSRTITTLEALYNSSLDIGMEEIAYNYEFFINTTNQLVRNIYTKRICQNPAKNILNLEQGVKRIGHGGFAFHVSLDRAYRLLIVQLSESAFCELQEIAIYPPFTAGLGAGKNAIYREYLAASILLFRETGLLQYNEKQWAAESIDCSLVQNNEVEVDMVHFAPALVLLATAMGVSFLTLMIELIWKWREKQKNMQ